MDFPLPEFLGLTQHIDVRIGSLYQEQNLYEHYPAFQRDAVWSVKMKQSLIDSIMRGYPIPELLAVRNGEELSVVDGRQRLSTIFDFKADKFATARQKEDPCLQPIEPNKRYSSLSAEMRARIHNYTLRVSIMDTMDARELGALFRRLQHQQSLILAETLWTFSSEATRVAAELATHSFWRACYHGNQTRKRTFQASLYLVSIELAGGTIDLTTAGLRALAAGDRDQAITPQLADTIAQRLATLDYMFRGTSLYTMKDLILMYEALIVLEQAGCDFEQSKAGCLSPWFAQVKYASLQARQTPGETDLLARLLSGRGQSRLWNQESEPLVQSAGVCLIDQKRAFSLKDREQALARQKGLCPSCGQPISLEDVGHHIILHSKGGPSTPENCMILHDLCHQRLHAMLPDTQWEQFKVA